MGRFGGSRVGVGAGPHRPARFGAHRSPGLTSCRSATSGRSVTPTAKKRSSPRPQHSIPQKRLQKLRPKHPRASLRLHQPLQQKPQHPHCPSQRLPSPTDRSVSATITTATACRALYVTSKRTDGTGLSFHSTRRCYRGASSASPICAPSAPPAPTTVWKTWRL